MPGERATYEIAEWAGKLSAALDAMKESEKPGAVERGGKRAVLSAMKEKIREVMNAGYSAAQIAHVLKQNGLPVLPKSITETAREAKHPARRAKRGDGKKNDAPNTVENATPNAPIDDAPGAMTNAPRIGSFEIDPDTLDV